MRTCAVFPHVCPPPPCCVAPPALLYALCYVERHRAATRVEFLYIHIKYHHTHVHVMYVVIVSVLYVLLFITYDDLRAFTVLPFSFFCSPISLIFSLWSLEFEPETSHSLLLSTSPRSQTFLRV